MKAVVAALLGAMMAVGVAAKTGNTIRGNTESCGYLSNSAVMVAIIRQSDARPWAAVRPELNEVMTEAVGSPQSYLETPEDVAFAMALFKLVWEAEGDLAIIEHVYNECVKPSGRNT